ncbi:hypothetical protein F2Q68_00035623 [Brassica cretica]|uniref:Secreted protein n=1 Tax=Brassica cretica TaxID=69181 RepID=A0A8S9GZA3_BRACR|nr:hypothetical protein F2Q68_00035623 [Brassica cretica]
MPAGGIYVLPFLFSFTFLLTGRPLPICSLSLGLGNPPKGFIETEGGEFWRTLERRRGKRDGSEDEAQRRRVASENDSSIMDLYLQAVRWFVAAALHPSTEKVDSKPVVRALLLSKLGFSALARALFQLKPVFQFGSCV